MKKITIYCDGACSGNPGPGGWGACIINEEGKMSQIYGHDITTTNNKMEMMGAIKALQNLSDAAIVDIYTDSKYLQMGMSQWIHKWLKNNWRTSDGKEVKNIELWQALLPLTQFHQVNWHWVKGHCTNKFNNLADSLAVKGRDQAISLKNSSLT
jgi:ribonuclease HI